MAQTQANPSILQQGDPSRTPLFLIHDAGGGVFNYLKLHPLHRPVYTISNPFLHSPTKYQGGTTTLVRTYISLIKSVLPHGGDILVGGWSLGGQLGIDIGRTLALDKRSRVRVVGVVMIDTLYPYWGPPGTVHAELPREVMEAPCPEDMKEGILRCSAWSAEDSVEWVERNWKDRDGRGELEGVEGLEPPPSVLLFATEYIPIDGGEGGGKGGRRAMMDYLRHDRGGWNLFPHGQFIVAVWDLKGHHFGLFEKDTIKDTSDKVRKACDLLAED